MSEVEYIITETPVGANDGRDVGEDDYESHARFTYWRGNEWSDVVLNWALSVSRHAPEDSTDYYITNIWRTRTSESGMFRRTTLIDITHQPEDLE